MALLNISDERPDQEISRLVSATINEACKEWSLPYEGEFPLTGVGISELRPRHVGISTDYWQMTGTTSWADWVNTTVSDNAYLVVTGIFNLTIDPHVTAIYPRANGLDMPRMHIEQMYAFEEPRAFFTKPYAIKADGNITIQTISDIAQTEKLGLLGYCIAKRAYLIAATPS